MNRQLLRIDSPKAWDNTQKPGARGKTLLEENKKTSKCFSKDFETFLWENEATVRFKHETWRASARLLMSGSATITLFSQLSL